MKFNIREIGAKGLSLSRELDREFVHGLLEQSGLEYQSGPANLSLDLVLNPVDTSVFITGSLQGRFSVSCSRCLGPCQIKVSEPDLQLTVLSTTTIEDEESLEDVQTFTFDGETLDLRPLIREHLVLAIPMAPLCDPQCKGICSNCGVQLNHETCSCENPGGEVRPWVAALQQLSTNKAGD